MSEASEVRSIQDLVQEFKNSPGKFLDFYESMNSREKILFQGWINSLRDTK
jgi:hypothetical protein